jgi:hypothetical protein
MIENLRLGDTVLLEDGREIQIAAMTFQKDYMGHVFLAVQDALDAGFSLENSLIFEAGTATSISMSMVTSIINSNNSPRSAGKCRCETFDVVNFGCKCGGV